MKKLIAMLLCLMLACCALAEGGETVTITYYTIEGSGRNREYVEKTTNVTLGFRKDFQENNKQ